ncbi:hypothetical protein PHLGIDRAFT_396661 [Phlebiopsis gigantea 11061_1 CR5-6]|uniref:Uncharacterized protein n=1 Tax=Phlebiopsis gigantea (strain 11061_1 CR5-6) TaxID=745531 RepID=A0A0C3SFE9_PHLG1|nr:hypothetical protein PHLGIDRAFT_396661 [Phlebiopsis gigantea 11061_1 CR5-6]
MLSTVSRRRHSRWAWLCPGESPSAGALVPSFTASKRPSACLCLPTLYYVQQKKRNCESLVVDGLVVFQAWHSLRGWRPPAYPWRSRCGPEVRASSQRAAQ